MDLFNVTILYTETIRKEELIEAVSDCSDKAKELFDILVNLAPLPYGVVIKQLRKAYHIMKKLDNGDYDFVDPEMSDSYDPSDDDDLKELIDRLDTIENRGQGMSIFELTKLGLIKSFLTDMRDDSVFVDLYHKLEEAIALVKRENEERNPSL